MIDLSFECYRSGRHYRSHNTRTLETKFPAMGIACVLEEPAIPVEDVRAAKNGERTNLVHLSEAAIRAFKLAWRKVAAESYFASNVFQG